MKNRTTLAAVTLVSAAIVIAILFWFSRGYGEVGPDAYRVAQALYGCCLAKSEPRLKLVDSLLANRGDEEPLLEINAKERQWLEAMVAKAKSGDWQSAAKAARAMMEDQVQH